MLVAVADPCRQPLAPVSLEDLPDLVERSFEAVAEIELWDDEQRVGGGTGFVAVLDDGGGGSSDLVVTNAHVASGGPEMKVFFKDGKEAKGELLGIHPMVDIALFRLEEPKERALELRGQGGFRLGEFVVALGHPQSFSWTATAGLISGLDRPAPHHNSGLPITMLQTSAEINHGNSGGPLVGLDGQVVGVNTSGITKHESMFKVDFAIPGHSARLAAEAIIGAGKNAQVPRPWTGLPIGSTPWKAPQEILVSYGIRGGAEVKGDPEDGSPAREAGLQDGDIVIGIDTTAVDDAGDLYTWMLDPGCLDHECEVKYLRDGKLETTAIRPVDRSLKE